MSIRSQRYPQELRERAVRLVSEVRDQYDSEWAAIESVATKLGIGSSATLRKWVRRAEVDAGERPGVTSHESAEARKFADGESRRTRPVINSGTAAPYRTIPTGPHPRTRPG